MNCFAYVLQRNYKTKRNMASSIITYKAVVMPGQKRKDGSFNIKIRVTFKRTSRYLSTNLTATARDITAKGELKGAALISANNLIGKFYNYASELNYFALQEMDVDDVIRYIRRKATIGGSFRLDFFEFGKAFASQKVAGTCATYICALNAFKRYLNADTLDINDITYQMLYDFGEFIDNEPKRLSKDCPHPKKKGASRSGYTRKIKAIYEAAKKKYNDEDNGIINIPRNPFQKLELKYTTGIVHSARSPEWIQHIISYDGPCSPGQRFALDMYIISFALMGMNAADLITAAPAKNGIITYYRAKTCNVRPDRAEHRVKIDPRIKPLISKYKDPKGKRLLNIYHYYRDNRALDWSLRSMYHSWAKANDEVPFSLYSARHSWGTIANSSRVGIDIALVDECLVHKNPSLKMAYVYVERDWENLWRANEKVLDLFDWSNIPNLAAQPLRQQLSSD